MNKSNANKNTEDAKKRDNGVLSKKGGRKTNCENLCSVRKMLSSGRRSSMITEKGMQLGVLIILT